jgi:NADH:ubiquinone reductase (non-electrogenic)
MAKTEQIEDELKQLSEEQGRAPNKESRDKVFEEIKDLQKRLRRVKQMGPFEYSHQGSLAYIGSEKAVADISWLTGNLASGGQLTYLFWRSAYLSMCFSSECCLFPPPFCHVRRHPLTASSHSTQPCPRLHGLDQILHLRT